jgi:phage gpG-like protein
MAKRLLTPREVKDALKKSSNELIKFGARHYALELEALVVKQINKMDLNVTGDMRKSVTHKVTEYMNKIVIRVGVNTKYAVYVHEGTKPHWPKRSAIERWVKLKFDPIDVRGTAYAVSRSIAKKGTKAHPFLKLVFNQEKTRAASRIAQAIKDSGYL